jgi:hypothetical protein
VTRIVTVTVTNSVTPKTEAKHELMFSQPTSGLNGLDRKYIPRTNGLAYFVLSVSDEEFESL